MDLGILNVQKRVASAPPAAREAMSVMDTVIHSKSIITAARMGRTKLSIARMMNFAIRITLQPKSVPVCN